MPTKFKNTFKKSDLDERNSFRQRVIGILREIYPEYDFSAGEEPEIILVGENKLGLTNLRAKFLLTSQTSFELKELTREHFANLSVLDFDNFREDKVWENVKLQILPQLIPLESIRNFPVTHFPFASEIVVGLVLDGDDSYSYVMKEDVETWNVSEQEVYRQAIENLIEKSYDLEMTFVPPPTAMLVVNTFDSFDAVRILAPQMTEFFIEKLGSSFYFGIPNRDFLICWAKNADSEFQSTIKKQIAVDFDERPYPLSPLFFEFDEISGIRKIDESLKF